MVNFRDIPMMQGGQNINKHGYIVSRLTKCSNRNKEHILFNG